MSLIKNLSGQFLYGVLVNATNGAAITTGATLLLAKDGAAEAAAAGTLTHRANGLWEAALTQADTNASILGYVWGGTDVIPQGGTIVTVDFARNAVGDILSIVGTSGVEISASQALEIADAILKRDWTPLSGEPAYCLLQAARFLRNKWNTTEVAGSVVIKKEDGITTAWQRTITTDVDAEPIIGVS
jgi:hypothetical protein